METNDEEIAQNQEKFGDIAHIEKYIKEEVPEPIQAGDLGLCFTSVYFISTILLMIIFFTTFRIKEAFEVRQGFSLYTIVFPFDDQGNSYVNITNTRELNDFILANVLINVYNEDQKTITWNRPGLHQMAFFNFYMGARVTYNKAEREDVQIEELTSKKRLTTYNGRTNKSFKHADKSPIVSSGCPMGDSTIEYNQGGGYGGNGGFVVFLPDNVELAEALNNYCQLTNSEYKLDDNMISITFEILVYNENYQTGILMVLEFLKDNAGKIDKTLSVTPFYESKYQGSYHMASSSQKKVEIAVDILFVLCIAFISYRIFKILIRKSVETARLKINMFELHDAFDLVILILNYITIGYYIKVIVLEDQIEMPVKTLERLTKYINEAEQTLILMYLSTGTIIVMTLRLIVIIIMHFPIFGAIFYTITSAFKDLMNIVVTL